IISSVKHLILVVSGREPTAQDQRLLTFAAWMGVPTKTLSVQDSAVLIDQPLDEFNPGPYCLAMSAETLSVVTSPSSGNLPRLIDGCSTELLVFGCTTSTEQCSALPLLTRGAISGIRLLGDIPARFTLPRAISLNRQLAGHSFTGEPGE